MKKCLITLTGALAILSPNIYANSINKDTILFVCGGNTGRSVMAEWYTKHTYKDLDTFSRGSGIDPNDEVTTEPYAEELILKNNDATKKEISLHRATPIALTDIYKANIVLTMGTKYSDRLKNTIDRECSDFNLNYSNRSFNKDQWIAMCNDKDQLKAKIYTLIGCATGADGDIPDAYGQNKEFYIDVRNQITQNIDEIIPTYIKTGQCPYPIIIQK
ncbi:hypothetical protein FRA_41c09280 [Francisella sp. W12-1067]|nr:hypothetical protein FRA_41c09280 [Francisella sp. W12-1067]